jgi:hypothetical protein
MAMPSVFPVTLELSRAAIEALGPEPAKAVGRLVDRALGHLDSARAIRIEQAEEQLTRARDDFARAYLNICALRDRAAAARKRLLPPEVLELLAQLDLLVDLVDGYITAERKLDGEKALLRLVERRAV